VSTFPTCEIWQHSKVTTMSRFACACVCFVAALGVVAEVSAQNPNYPGYLGVRVYGHRYGMQIRSFIRGTPAAELAARGELEVYDVITRLGGRQTRSMGQLLSARDDIPDGQEAKMVLRSPEGYYHHVWISRNEGAVAAGVESAMEFRSGGRGEGGSENYRMKGSDGGSDYGDSGGDFREKR
jgi:hypothetical protein